MAVSRGIGVSLLVCLQVACLAADFKPPSPEKRERAAIIREASRAIHKHVRPTDPAKRRGQDIGREFWGPAIRRLKPVRVYDDRVNVAIVLKENAREEEGLYVTIPISSYAPGFDERFSSFVQLSQTRDGTLGELYRYKMEKKQPKAP
jgi:hypothetical protein